MRFALVGVLIAQLCSAADGGVELKPTVTHLRDGGYLVPEVAWNALDVELRRLQFIEKNPPPPPPGPPVQAYLIGMAIVGSISLAAGIAIGYRLGQK